MIKKCISWIVVFTALIFLAPQNISKAQGSMPPGPPAPGQIKIAEQTGDNPPSTSYRWIGHGGVSLGSVAYSFANDPSGYITISGIPNGSKIVQAFFYATTWECFGEASATFQNQSLNNTKPIYTDSGGGLNLGMYVWNVSDLVSGNGSYSYTTFNVPHSYASYLVVIYGNDSQPIRQVIVNEGMESLVSSTSTTTFTGVVAGHGRLILTTEADDSSGAGSEEIDFNSQVLASGDVFHANLGEFASYFDYNVNALNGTNTARITTGDDWFGWHLAILEIESGTIPQTELTGLEVTQGIQDLSNTVELIKNKPTFVRAHVKSSSPMSHISARLFGTRGGTALPSSPLSPINNSGSIDISSNPNRGALNDSYLFELPHDWLSGNVEVNFYLDGFPLNCKETAGIPNDCKASISFIDRQPLNVRIVGAEWHESQGKVHAPTDDQILSLVRELEAVYPIPYLQWDHPYNFSLVVDDFVQDPTTLNLRLGEQRVLDGCVNVGTVGCQRLYLGVIVDPIASVGLYGLGGFPANVASGFWIDNDLTRGILPHELSHALGRLHTPFCKAVSVPWWKYPYPEGHISQTDSGDSALYGFHIFSREIFPPTTGDLMSYCFPVWPSDWTYKALSQEINNRFSSSLASPADVSSPTNAVLMISGKANPSLGTGSFESIFTINATEVPSLPLPGEYNIRFVNTQGLTLATTAFQLDEEGTCSPDCTSEQKNVPFILTVLPVPNTARIDLLKGEKILAQREVSVHPPSISLLSPNGGQTLSGESVLVNWTANDLDGNPLTFALQYSKDAGNTWLTIASGLDSYNYTASLSTLSGTSSGMFRVLVSDGYWTAQDTSDSTFQIADHAPSTIIVQPDDQASFTRDQLVNFEAEGYDLEDGPLTGSSYTWTSNRDGVLGSGQRLDFPAASLSEGAHTITLTASDSLQHAVVKQITVNIYRIAPVLPPQISIGTEQINFHTYPNEETKQQTIIIRNLGGGQVTWQASVDQSWIKLDATSGTTPYDLGISANPGDLSIGDYSGTVTLKDADHPEQSFNVKVELYVIDVSPKKVFIPLVQR